MNDNDIVLKASNKLCQLSFRKLANRLEHDTKNTIPEAVSVLREHYFHRLADRLRRIGK